MSEGIPYADIVIMALVAGFILLRLRSVLGHKVGHDTSELIKRQRPQETGLNEPVVQAQERPAKSRFRDEPSEDLAAVAEASAAQGLLAIKARDSQFSATSFLQGAKAAFEMVLDAFAKNDQKTLKMLLSDELYKEVAADLDSRAKEEQRMETTLVSVQARKITSASLEQNRARIKVKFASEQIAIVRDKAGKIVEGDVSDIQPVEDEWMFERDVTAKNPNWKIIET
jgi:predicted lipid-binding transport protein (Tim44 family)